MAASAIITLDQRRVKKGGVYPVKLRISYKAKTRDFQTVYDLTPEDFRKLKAPHLGKELREISRQLDLLKSKAETLCSTMRGFSFEKIEFELYTGEPCLKKKKKREEPFTLLAKDLDLEPFKKRFKLLTDIHPGKDYISYVFSSYTQMLLQQERLGSALNYQHGYNSLFKFGGNVRFEEITVTYLVRYEKWCLSRGVSKTYVGIVLRSLRTIFNEAIFRKIIRKEDCYPFGRRQYMLPTSRKTKKALTLGEVKQIFEFRTEDERVERARNYWLFCYMANGMNPKDMAFLQWKNIDGEFINFERAKTERSSRGNPILITVYISPQIQAILDQYGNPDKSSDSYIFPVMRPGLNMLEQFDVLNHFRTFINKGIRKVAKELKIEKNVSNVVSRHTFSTVLLHSGVKTEFIKDSLGHTSVITTENYLSSFENAVKKEYAGRLTAFEKLDEEQH
ncbi:MAG: site-specific integrase [Chitinophagaceae bacterium]|jgi:integrase/recombinase XerD|nr:site-specific integrase [Chitinophagaceae bacterium]MCA6439321.1 site-specific integrase [Chitinophagaceae bacterium]MCA6448117.1 site-specific integrase [Chitinophagaceae bacterium]